MRVLRSLPVGLILGVWIALIVAAAPAQASPGAAPGPGEVEVYALVGNIQSVDISANTFAGDFVVGLRWTDPALHPQDTLRLLNAADASSITVSSSGEPVKGADGTFTWTQRVQGPFASAFSLESYPFQTQQLVVAFDAPGAFVASPQPVGMSATTTLPGYSLGHPQLIVGPAANRSVFGTEATGEARSSIVVSVPLESPVLAGIMKVLLPVIIVIVATALIFLVPPDHTDARLGLGITALLTLVALQLGTGLPNVTYLSMLDVIFMAAFGFVVAAMALVIWNMWTVRAGDESAVIRRDRVSLIALPAIYILANVLILVAFLR